MHDSNFVPVDDHFHEHPRIRKVGHWGQSVYLFAMLASDSRSRLARYRLEPAQLAAALNAGGYESELATGVSALLGEGLLEATDHGYRVHELEITDSRPEIPEFSDEPGETAGFPTKNVKKKGGGRKSPKGIPTRKKERKKEGAQGAPACVAEKRYPKPSDWASYSKDMKRNHSIAYRCIAYLNELTGSRFRCVTPHVKRITTLISDGYTEIDIRDVIRLQVREWGKKEEMRPYLRPSTLFGRENFANYHGRSEGLKAAKVTKKDKRPAWQKLGMTPEEAGYKPGEWKGGNGVS